MSTNSRHDQLHVLQAEITTHLDQVHHLATGTTSPGLEAIRNDIVSNFQSFQSHLPHPPPPFPDQPASKSKPKAPAKDPEYKEAAATIKHQAHIKKILAAGIQELISSKDFTKSWSTLPCSPSKITLADTEDYALIAVLCRLAAETGEDAWAIKTVVTPTVDHPLLQCLDWFDQTLVTDPLYKLLAQETVPAYTPAGYLSQDIKNLYLDTSDLDNKGYFELLTTIMSHPPPPYEVVPDLRALIIDFSNLAVGPEPARAPRPLLPPPHPQTLQLRLRTTASVVMKFTPRTSVELRRIDWLNRESNPGPSRIIVKGKSQKDLQHNYLRLTFAPRDIRSQAAHLSEGIPGAHVQTIVAAPASPSIKKACVLRSGLNGAEQQVRRVPASLHQGYSTLEEAHAAFAYAQAKNWTGVRRPRNLATPLASVPSRSVLALPTPLDSNSLMPNNHNPLHGTSRSPIRKWYIVYAGITPGICSSYLECALNTLGLSSATHDSTTTLTEAQERWRDAIGLCTIHVITPPYTAI
ncbi:hypothetical protein C8R43DRAFT_948468 [Mycena crocata]|nr:hypothetical protein C8R43DRAFT_948468 [Mycena crocata]